MAKAATRTSLLQLQLQTLSRFFIFGSRFFSGFHINRLFFPLKSQSPQRTRAELWSEGLDATVKSGQILTKVTEQQLRAKKCFGFQ
jgi:hypothetical protein